MIGGSTISDSKRGERGSRRPAPGKAVTMGVLLACSLALGTGSVSGQMLQERDDPGRLVVPLPDDDWALSAEPDHDAIGASQPRQEGMFRRPSPACADRLSGPWFAPPPGRHRGLGHPLTCESWRFRPCSAGWFIGLQGGGSLIDDWVGGKHGFFGGYRLGWDYDHYWGCEMRFSFGTVALCDSQRAKDAAGIAEDDPLRDRFRRRRDATLAFWDVDLLYYPWGDAAWRPYLMLGLGTARTEFVDRLSIRYRETVFAMPLALGLKYRLSSCTALRLELADNIAFGDSFNTVQYLSLTAGMEIRFGGSRVAYWPWNPGRHYW
jgi:hypothetical protein